MKKMITSPLIGEGYSEDLHERWKLYKKWDKVLSEQHYIEMQDGSVTLHKWDVKTNKFVLLNFYRGVAEYRWDGASWCIERCDLPEFMTIINDSKLKNYPNYRFKNMFSMQRETICLNKENMIVSNSKREMLHHAWHEKADEVSALIIPYADWDDLAQSSLDPAYPITFMVNESKHNLKLDLFYAQTFMYWFEKVDNPQYYYVIPKVLESVPYGGIAKVPRHFLDYPLQEWVKAKECYQKMPIEEYRVLFDHELPLTPKINEVPSYQEVSLL